ncbi:MAG TPA: DUF2855 family protein [Acidimicrobiales bacterium]|nr:DUF2855 family protein [Acidimicrobiales bacterium]
MTDTTRFVVVDRSDPRSVEVREEPHAPLEDGQVRFKVDSFAFTANSVTYMVAGDMLGYWDFYPFDLSWGRSPVMGHGEVVESAHPDVPVGGRYFGWFPIATDVVVNVEPSASGLRDVGEHRSSHNLVYRTFEASDDPASEDHTALIRGLFTTSFLADDFLADNDDFGATQAIVLSASSKTGIALGWCLTRRGHHAIGATSPGNAEFVRSLGCWDEVVTYDELGDLDGSVRTNLVDMSGNSDAVSTVHRTFDGTLGHSMLIGMTHWESPRSSDPLPGPAPAMFFAPSQIDKRLAEWGSDGYDARVGETWKEFSAWSNDWLTVTRYSGIEDAMRAYQSVVAGHAKPNEGLILSLNE